MTYLPEPGSHVTLGTYLSGWVFPLDTGWGWFSSGVQSRGCCMAIHFMKSCIQGL